MAEATFLSDCVYFFFTTGTIGLRTSVINLYLVKQENLCKFAVALKICIIQYYERLVYSTHNG